jgi:hypothetical protein
MISGRPRNTERVSALFTWDPEKSPTRLVLSGSATLGGRFCQPCRFMSPKAQFLTIHLDHNHAVLTSLDEATSDRQINPVLSGS